MKLELKNKNRAWRRHLMIMMLVLWLAVLSVGVPVVCAKSQSLGGITLTEIRPRILTPNGDTKNDKIFFVFDTTLTGVPIDSEVFDLNGAQVANLNLDLNDTVLSWDGKDSAGRFLPAGIYIYSIKIGKNQASGAVVLGR